MLQDITIIMLPARDEVRCLDEAFSTGAIDYITKSVNSVELMVRARSVWD